ncbi:AEC family transporter [Georgenia sp. Z1344]|uniref:AEC family transporter n=1 Tax=Georgenia sp. Z1344 TaxID=3416706 RepID=UPI003CF74ADB
MTGVVTGFAGLTLIVVVGYVLARTGVVGKGGADTLSTVVFHVGVPMLMLTTVATADVAHVLSLASVVTIVTALLVAALFVVVARTILRVDAAGTVVGALSASYVNAGNIGLPILVLAVGTAAPVVPAMMLQLLVLAPLSCALLDRFTGRSGSGWRRVVTPVLSPPVLGVIAGLVLSFTGLELPTVLAQPVQMLADMTVPMLLVAFGLSIHGGGSGPDREPTPVVWTAIAMRLALGPFLAWVIGGPVAGLEGDVLLGVVVVAALPTAQNVFVYAMRYEAHVDLARRAILVTSVACVPVIVAATGLLS